MFKIPEGFVQCSKDEFFRLLYKTTEADGIMPHLRDKTFTTWEYKDRRVWGYDAPGWGNPGEHEHVYFVRKSDKKEG